MSGSNKDEKSGAQKLRERFYKIKQGIHTSDELKEALIKDKEKEEHEIELNKKIAKPHHPREADI